MARRAIGVSGNLEPIKTGLCSDRSKLIDVCLVNDKTGKRKEGDSKLLVNFSFFFLFFWFFFPNYATFCCKFRISKG